jgi:NAD(P)-dependent dehydrogenase (short-subunit alcohol dehydrogenase family)
MTDHPDASSPVTFVTGGASGIGASAAEVLATRGHRVVVTDLDGSVAQRTAAQLPHAGHLGLGCDVRSADSVDQAVASAVEACGAIDSVVTCAGMSRVAPSADVHDDDLENMVDVHLLGSIRTLRAAFPHLAGSRRPAVVAMSSMGAHLGIPGRLGYCVAKGGVEAMVKTLAVEWSPHGIRVNATAPGWVKTPAIARLVQEGLLDEEPVIARTPLQRLAAPREIAECIAFLLDRASSYITGQTFIVDGGMTVQGPIAPPGQMDRSDRCEPHSVQKRP